MGLECYQDSVDSWKFQSKKERQWWIIDVLSLLELIILLGNPRKLSNGLELISGEMISLPFIILQHKPYSPDPKLAIAECIEEVETICKHIHLVDRHFGEILLLEDLSEMAFLCQFHFENYIFRVYAIRERLWDILARLAGIHKGKSSEKVFKEKVQSSLEMNFPGLAGEYSEFVSHFRAEVEMRNYITHEGFVRPAIVLASLVDNFDNIKALAEYVKSDVQDIDKWKLASPEDVRGAIETFVAGEKNHIRRIIKETTSFLASCKTASEQKDW